MSTNERDTKFQGFAKLQMPELDILFTGLYKASIVGNMPLRDAYIQRIETLLAQRAYDLVYHDHMNIEHIDLDRLTLEEQVAKIPDLTQWPESSTDQSS